MEQSIINFAIYENSVELLGVASVSLPDISFATQELSGAGIAGSIETVIQSYLQSMTLGLNFRSTTKQALNLLAPVPHLIELRIAQNNLNEINGTMGITAPRHVFQVVPKSYSAGTVAPATNGDASGSYAVQYWKCMMKDPLTGKETVFIELDPLHYKCVINGVDYAAPVRAALGKA